MKYFSRENKQSLDVRYGIYKTDNLWRCWGRASPLLYRSQCSLHTLVFFNFYIYSVCFVLKRPCTLASSFCHKHTYYTNICIYKKYSLYIQEKLMKNKLFTPVANFQCILYFFFQKKIYFFSLSSTNDIYLSYHRNATF